MMKTNTTEAVSRIASPTLLYTLTSIQYIGPSAVLDSQEELVREHTLLGIANGMGRLFLDGAAFGLTRGSCFLLVPGMTVRLETEDGQQLTYYQLGFDVGRLHADLGGSADRPVVDAGALPCCGEVVCSPFSTCLAWFEDIYGHRDAREQIDVFRNHVRFHDILLFLFQQNERVPIQAENGWRQAVESSIQYIAEHYHTLVTVEELASIANIERWKYTRLFKEVTGQVPLQYLNDMRIERTKELLRMTDDRLYDIAQHVGFNNEYYLNRRFKQKVGISPGQYRRNYREPQRIIAPYMEDFLLALDIVPVVQYAHTRWGKQDYLGLDDVPTFDMLQGSFEALSAYNPDLIILMDRYDDCQYMQCRQISSTFVVRQQSDHWREVLRTVADLFGRTEQAEQVIAAYEDKARAARAALHSEIKKQTVAVLRISADHIFWYAAADKGFTGSVLYKDLALPIHPLSLGAASTSRMISLSMDGLARLDAEHLFITFDKWHSQEPGAERRLLGDPVWQSLPAVRNGRVYEVDFLTWMNNGVISNGKKIDGVLQVLV